MPSFTSVWNSTYETIPADTEQESLGAGEIRDFKIAVRQRLQTDHSLNGDVNDGMHQSVTLLAQAADPAPSFLAGTSGASFYTKTVGAIVELFYKNSLGALQLTNAGTLQGMFSGAIMDCAAGTIPPGWLECNGQAVSRTGATATLFNAIGVTFGPGDGSTTFNVPNLNGYTTIGRNGTIVPNLGQFSGADTMQLAVTNLPSYNLPINDPGHTHPIPTGNSTANQIAVTGGTGTLFSSGSTGSSGTGISVSSGGGNTPFSIMQKSAVMIKVIKI